MKEIETLVEEKTKESLDVSRLTREGERTELRALWLSWRQQGSGPTLAGRTLDAPSSGPKPSWARPHLASESLLTRQQNFHLGRALRIGFWERN